MRIFGDWGSTRLRLYLLDGDNVLDLIEDDGIKGVTTCHRQVLENAVGRWAHTGYDRRIWLCGMVGSRNGWREVPYAALPCSSADLANGVGLFAAGEHVVAIVPGVRTAPAVPHPDVMRGEETQIAGAIALQPQLATGQHSLVLPGTHSKWVTITDGRITDFRTATTGEMFAMLRAHSLLIDKDAAADDGSGFNDGIECAFEAPEDLLFTLFSARSRSIIGGKTGSWGAGFVSGLLIGSEIAAAIGTISGPVTLIGDSGLCEHYQKAFRQAGKRCYILNGTDCVIAGLNHISGLLESTR